jgi:hypothetical protein
MKILLAITSTRPKTMADNSLRWAGQLGYAVRVFTPTNKRKKFLAAIADVNYHWYLALDAEEVVVSRYSPSLYANLMGFDLIVHIPDDLATWHKRMAFSDKEINHTFSAIGNARGEFSRSSRKRIKRWHNGVVMERVQ